MRPQLVALTKTRADGTIELRSPSVGLWRDPPPEGALLRPGMRIGAVEVLGQLVDLVVPPSVAGLARGPDRGRARARLPVNHGELLVLLSPEIARGSVEAEAERSRRWTSGATFVSPMSGRFYRRASPDKPAFVEEGDELGAGQTICLLEVMKTFNRIVYGGGGLPERARVLRIVPTDGDDLAAGDPILELEPM